MKKSILLRGSVLLKKLKLPDTSPHKKALEKAHTNLLNAVHDFELCLGYLQIAQEENPFRINITDINSEQFFNVFSNFTSTSYTNHLGLIKNSLEDTFNTENIKSLPTASRKDKQSKRIILSLKNGINKFIDDPKNNIMVNTSLESTIKKSIKITSTKIKTKSYEEFLFYSSDNYEESLFDCSDNFENHWLYKAMVAPTENDATSRIKSTYFCQNMIHQDFLGSGLCHGLAYDFLIQQNNSKPGTQLICPGITLKSQLNAMRIHPNTALKSIRCAIFGFYPFGKSIYRSGLFNAFKEKIRKELTKNNNISFCFAWTAAFTRGCGHALAVHKKHANVIIFYDANTGVTEFNSVHSFIDMLEKKYKPGLNSNHYTKVPAGAAFQLFRYYPKHSIRNFFYHYGKYHLLNPWYYLSQRPLKFLVCTALLLSIFISVFGPISIALSGCLILSSLLSLGIIPPILHAWDSLKEKTQNYFSSIFPAQNFDKPSHKPSTNFNNANPNERSMNNNDPPNKRVFSNGSMRNFVDDKEKKSFTTASRAWSSLPPPTS